MTKGTSSFLAAIWQQTSEASDSKTDGGC
jgi:hypothetical protein